MRILINFIWKRKNSYLAITPYKKQAYPEFDKPAKDEQHRFELLLSHWDVMTEKIILDK